jgi:hypothetical protein
MNAMPIADEGLMLEWFEIQKAYPGISDGDDD